MDDGYGLKPLGENVVASKRYVVIKEPAFKLTVSLIWENK
jgi:hypothetical protein